MSLASTSSRSVVFAAQAPGVGAIQVIAGPLTTVSVVVLIAVFGSALAPIVFTFFDSWLSATSISTFGLTGGERRRSRRERHDDRARLEVVCGRGDELVLVAEERASSGSTPDCESVARSAMVGPAGGDLRRQERHPRRPSGR